MTVPSDELMVLSAGGTGLLITWLRLGGAGGAGPSRLQPSSARTAAHSIQHGSRPLACNQPLRQHASGTEYLCYYSLTCHGHRHIKHYLYTSGAAVR